MKAIAPAFKSSKPQIGKSGELLTQYYLLRDGIESSPMTTDSGIDLLARWLGHTASVQVKTQENWEPAGGKGKDSAGWWINDSKKVDYLALALLCESSIWVLAWEDVERMACQHNSKGNMQLAFYSDPNVRTEPKRLRRFWEPFRAEHGIRRTKLRMEGRSLPSVVVPDG